MSFTLANIRLHSMTPVADVINQVTGTGGAFCIFITAQLQHRGTSNSQNGAIELGACTVSQMIHCRRLHRHSMQWYVLTAGNRVMPRFHENHGQTQGEI